MDWFTQFWVGFGSWVIIGLSAYLLIPRRWIGKELEDDGFVGMCICWPAALVILVAIVVCGSIVRLRNWLHREKPKPQPPTPMGSEVPVLPPGQLYARGNPKDDE